MNFFRLNIKIIMKKITLNIVIFYIIKNNLFFIKKYVEKIKICDIIIIGDSNG